MASTSALGKIKQSLYFPVASYFRFFAKFKLARWNPRIVVITGSSGKTTLMNMAVAQFKKGAEYSHHANSSFGIPFNILGLQRKSLKPQEWIYLFLAAPFKVFSSVPSQKIYIVEADCDRLEEGVFLSSLLKPEVTIWLSSARSHSMNFDNLVKAGIFKNVEDAIAFEYGYFLDETKKLAIVNSDSSQIFEQTKRTNVEIKKISKNVLNDYTVSKEGTKFKIKDEVFKFKFLLPEAAFSSVYAVKLLTEYFTIPFDSSFAEFELPPGRSSIFKGVKNITIVDSCYNSNFSSASEIINMFNKIPANKKWVVVGDMLEQGSVEKEEHEKLANLVVDSKFEKVILIGPRIYKHGFEILEKHYEDNVVHYDSPKDVLDYLKDNIQGGETILFKGARFLEGVIEDLLENKNDAKKLSRREKIWEERRKKWGL